MDGDAGDLGGAPSKVGMQPQSIPSNHRWLPYDILLGVQDPLQLPHFTTATDVYSYGILLWELFSARTGGGEPYSADFPTDDGLLTAVHADMCMPPIALGATTVAASALDLITDVFAACTKPSPQDRPWISNVATMLLDLTPERWEKDKNQLEHVQNLGSGEFGLVVKMSTRLFSTDGTKGFVAVKMLTSAPKGGADGAGTGGGGIDGDSIVQGSSTYHDHGLTGDALNQGSSTYHTPKEEHGDDAGAASSLEADFLREATLMKQFRHPNLVQLLGVCTATKPMMMILEFLTGGSLDQWLPANGPLLLKPTSSKLVHILHQVALGMTELGKAGIVHRDLACRNVLIDETLQVKVADYGRCWVGVRVDPTCKCTPDLELLGVTLGCHSCGANA